MEKLFSKEELQYQLSRQARKVTGWPQTVLIIAGMYNVLFGIWAVFFPGHYLFISSTAQDQALILWQCLGMVIGLYGLGYLIASHDICRYWPLVFIGLLGKVFGPMGFVYHLWQGSLQFSMLYLIVFNDIIWWLPFSVILLKVVRSKFETAESEQAKEKALLRYEELLRASMEKPVVLMFLRHRGCQFTTDWLSVVNNILKARHTEVYLVSYSGTEYSLDALDVSLRKQVRHIADPYGYLYEIFKIPTVSLWQAFGFPVWKNGMQSVLRHGCTLSMPDGNPLQGAALLLIKEEETVFKQLPYFVSEKPDVDGLQGAIEQKDTHNFTIFYDGGCPLCALEISFLKKRTGSKVVYSDIASSSFDAKEVSENLSHERLMSEIHGMRRDGSIVVGVEVFREVYKHAGLGYLLAPTSWPVLRTLADFAYRVFARYRLRLTGRAKIECTSCSL